MEQCEVSFEVKKYFRKNEYEKDGCPVLYFEFNNHDYYGLIAVRTDLSELNKVQRAIAKSGEYKAAKLYSETIAGENVEEVLEQGYPTQISKSEALLKYLLAPDLCHKTVRELVKEFEEVENGVLLVDGSLV